MRNVKKENYQCVHDKLCKHNQLHLLDYYSQLNEEEKESFLNQLNEIDYARIEQAINSDQVRSRKKQEKNVPIEPMDVMSLQEIEQNKESLYEIGMKAIRNGRVAVVVLAGGQATRLGIDKPKGMLNIGITKPLYLFEIIVSKLKDTALKAGHFIDLYILVNGKNAQEIKDFFRVHNYFGYKKEHILFFEQNMYPKVFFDGKIVLEEKGRVATAPGGNGEWFDALSKNHFVEKLKRNKVEWINVLSVDNPLYNIVDASFLGALIKQDGQLGVQVVEKSNPYEKVGVICKQNNKPCVKEYYEMTQEEQEAVNEQNELFYRYGVILNYMFKLTEIEKIETSALPFHLAVKKIPFLNRAGEIIRPDKENGYIVERLALDFIHLFDNVLAYEVDREKNFAPIKNRVGEDSIETARNLLRYNDYEL